MTFPDTGDEPFSYRATADGRVAIRWNGRLVTVLRGRAAARFLTRVEGIEGAAVQLEMARATGNFKRGNERRAQVHENRRGR